MKSIRQRKVLAWEKTSPFWWNSFYCIYYRFSYSKSPNVIFQQMRIAKTLDKITEKVWNSTFQTSLIFFTQLTYSKHPTVPCYDNFHIPLMVTDFGLPILKKILKDPWLMEQVLELTCAWTRFCKIMPFRVVGTLEILSVPWFRVRSLRIFLRIGRPKSVTMSGMWKLS